MCTEAHPARQPLAPGGPAPPNCFYFAANQVLDPFVPVFLPSVPLLYLSILKICLFVVSTLHVMAYEWKSEQPVSSVPPPCGVPGTKSAGWA